MQNFLETIDTFPRKKEGKKEKDVLAIKRRMNNHQTSAAQHHHDSFKKPWTSQNKKTTTSTKTTEIATTETDKGKSKDATQTIDEIKTEERNKPSDWKKDNLFCSAETNFSRDQTTKTKKTKTNPTAKKPNNKRHDNNKQTKNIDTKTKGNKKRGPTSQKLNFDTITRNQVSTIETNANKK